MLFNHLGETIEEKLIGHYHFEEHETVLKYQIFMLLILMILASLIIGPMSVIRYLQQEYVQAADDLLFVIILGINFHLLRRSKARFKAIARFVIASALMTILVLMYTRPDSFIPIIWISSTIYLMFFLLNKVEAWKWLGSVVLIIFALYISGGGLQHFTPIEMYIIFGNILLLTLILTWYETFKEESERQHRRNEVVLQDEIARRTAQLRQTNLQLEKLNSTLEERVKKEIEKNREKDRIMLAQSRQAAMGDMISMIAHQWRQPITTIGMSAQNMQLDIELDEVVPERFKVKLQNIIDQTHYLSRTIDDFRDFLKPNKKPTHCTLIHLAEGAVSIIGKSLKNNNITLEKRYESDFPVTTYCNETIQVLLNILFNAKDIMKINGQQDGVIELRVYTEGEEGRFEICDNAGGIPETVMPHIFEPYFSTKEAKGGTGLGLYISQMIVEKRLGGTITASNRGEGACFTLSIPLTPEQP